MNNVFLIGRLTKDPELRFTAGKGTAVTRFSLAVTRKSNKDEADFINCVAFGKNAEHIAQYLTKGRKVAVAGSIKTGSYEKDSVKHYTTTVVADRCDFLDFAKQTDDVANTAQPNFEDMTPVDDGDMPF